MTALYALIRKDILLYLHNRRALLLNLLMPVVLGAFFGYLFGGSGEQQGGKIEVALVVQDDGPIGQRIVAAISAEKVLNVKTMDEAQARNLVEHGKVSAAIIVPKHFGDDAARSFFSFGEKPALGVLFDPSQKTTLAMLKGILTQHVMEVVSAEAFGGAAGSKVVDESLAALASRTTHDPQSDALVQVLTDVKQLNTQMQNLPANERRAGTGLSMPFTTHDEALTSGPQQYNGYAHSFAGMAVQFVLFFAINAGIEVLSARKLGIWNRLLAAPISPYRLLTARIASASLIAMALLCAIFMMAHLLFKVNVTGSLPGMLAIIASFSLMTGGFGVLVAALGKTPEAARSLSSFAVLIMVMLGGAWVPSFIFPAWLQTATLIVPTRWAVDGFDAMTWRGLGIEAAIGPVAVMLLSALLFGGIGVWRLGRELATQR